ncbi:deoxyribodipyrimidine photo-lyase-like [Physella acuta]|uniref:deoxyribodipyrimidine photo-lyase-like n=1 Tax=Physella acuta TaxID=109671 RepID=UPI0027DDFCB6|nr:deoxyribodipyrimidine photo-lyase-like [Physella acuta]
MTGEKSKEAGGKGRSSDSTKTAPEVKESNEGGEKDQSVPVKDVKSKGESKTSSKSSKLQPQEGTTKKAEDKSNRKRPHSPTQKLTKKESPESPNKKPKLEDTKKLTDRKGKVSKPKGEKDKEEQKNFEQDIAETDGQEASGGEEKDFILRVKKKREAVCADVSKFKFNKKRVRVLSKAEECPDGYNGILYWMSRDQRVQDNWALLYAQRLAMKLEVPLHVCFCLVPKFLEATIRQFGFMLKGLALVEKECQNLGIPFHLLIGEASHTVLPLLKKLNIGGVVTDFSPLRVPMKWVNDLKTSLPKDIPFCQVDAHNIVPCWEASPKLEYGARTIRSKINNKLGEYLTEFPPVVKHPHPSAEKSSATDWEKADSYLEVDRTVKEVAWAQPGTEAGLRMLESFCEKRLKYFSSDRNDPNKEALSNLSPWFHFGQLSVQRSILMVKLYCSKSSDSVNAFIEEAVVRRELADNFCFYNPDYDSFKGTNDWAKKSLELHRKDKREYIYTREQLENSKSHDDLWNAAQRQLVVEGKMHGFLRMYWAKKILEWTKSPEEALAEAIFLNDKYNIDGRDPNGYVGCMWSICGIHDRAWPQRPVFGKIRFMNYQGCKRKFDVPAFVRKYNKKVA